MLIKVSLIPPPWVRIPAQEVFAWAQARGGVGTPVSPR